MSTNPYRVRRQLMASIHSLNVTRENLAENHEHKGTQRLTDGSIYCKDPQPPRVCGTNKEAKTNNCCTNCYDIELSI